MRFFGRSLKTKPWTFAQSANYHTIVEKNRSVSFPTLAMCVRKFWNLGRVNCPNPPRWQPCASQVVRREEIESGFLKHGDKCERKAVLWNIGKCGRVRWEAKLTHEIMVLFILYLVTHIWIGRFLLLLFLFVVCYFVLRKINSWPTITK